MGEERLVGYLTAFLRPFPWGLLQLETIQVRNRRQRLGYKEVKERFNGPPVSAMLGVWGLRWAYDRNCNKAELLAVRDTVEMEAILVRLYER